MNTQFTQSLAGSGRKYVVGQGKLSHGRLHMQFASDQTGNRPYGLAVDAEISPTVQTFFGDSHNQTAKSLATGTFGYVPLQVSVNGGNDIHVQAQGTYQRNREYGFSFNIESAELADWLNFQMKEAQKVQTAKVNETLNKFTFALPVAADPDEDEDEGDEDETAQTKQQAIAESFQNVIDAMVNLKKLLS